MPLAEIDLRCKAERKVIGTVVARPGTRLDAETLRTAVVPIPGYALTPARVQDGVQLLCPRCHNSVVVDDTEEIHLVPGLLRVSGSGGPGSTPSEERRG